MCRRGNHRLDNHRSAPTELQMNKLEQIVPPRTPMDVLTKVRAHRPRKFDLPIRILAEAYHCAIEEIEGIPYVPGWHRGSVTVEHDADGLNPQFARRIKKIRQLLDEATESEQTG